MPDPVSRCDQPTCPFAKDGRCMESFTPPDKCPHLTAAAPAKKASPKPKQTKISAAGTLDLPDGEAMLAAAAASITRAHRTRVVVLIGDQESGKTTLLAALYEQFLRGPYAGFLFAGSQTLPGLERRCHLSRIAADSEEARTVHTLLTEGVRFLHLRLRRDDGVAPAQDLLFSDISGELLRQACESREEAQKHGEVRRADHFVLLLDGDKLRKSTERSKALRAGYNYLRSFLDYEVLDPQALVDVLITKWDLLDGTASADKLLAQVERDLASFHPRVRRLRLSRVAARPDRKRSQLPLAYGLEPLFRSWIEEAHPMFTLPTEPWIEPGGTSEFDRYLRRRMPHLFQGAKQP